MLDSSAVVHRGADSTDGFFVLADHARLYYRTLGSGRDTVLVLHGGPGADMHGLYENFAPLAVGRTLIFYDQRGGGQSTPAPSDSMLSADQHVADLEAIRRALRIDRLTIIGHSWGGALAGLYAMRYPNHVKRLVIANSLWPRRQPFDSMYHRRFVSRLSAQDRAEYGEAQRSLETASDPVAVCRRFLHIYFRATSAHADAGDQLAGDPCDEAPDVTRTMLRRAAITIASLGDYDWRSRLATVDAPTLVIHGSADALPEAASKEWATSVADGRLLTIQDAGHIPYAEHPNEFFRAVDSFLRGEWPVRSRHLGTGTASQSAPSVPPREYRIDAGHSTVEFAIPFAYTRVRGRFDDVRGSVVLLDSPDTDIRTAGIAAVIQTASVNTGSSHRDDHLRTSDFFDVQRFPTMRFLSDSAKRTVGGFDVFGQLAMHGHSRSVQLHCRSVVDPTADPHGGIVRVISGMTTVARRDFGILGSDAHNPWFDRLRSATMGDSVAIALEIHLWAPNERSRSAGTRAIVARIDSIGIDSAVASLRAAYARDSVRVAAGEPALRDVGLALLDDGRTRDGFLWLHALARLLPRSSDAMVSVGWANERMNDGTRADIWYRQAVAADSLNTRALAHLIFLKRSAASGR